MRSRSNAIDGTFANGNQVPGRGGDGSLYFVLGMQPVGQLPAAPPALAGPWPLESTPWALRLDASFVSVLRPSMWMAKDSVGRSGLNHLTSPPLVIVSAIV